jgi:long-chain acyl-CoA synthetase
VSATTRAAFVVAVKWPDDNVPESAGIPLLAIEVRLGEQDELLEHGPSVMMGYWNRPEETVKAIPRAGCTGATKTASDL